MGLPGSLITPAPPPSLLIRLIVPQKPVCLLGRRRVYGGGGGGYTTEAGSIMYFGYYRGFVGSYVRLMDYNSYTCNLPNSYK